MNANKLLRSFFLVEDATREFGVSSWPTIQKSLQLLDDVTEVEYSEGVASVVHRVTLETSVIVSYLNDVNMKCSLIIEEEVTAEDISPTSARARKNKPTNALCEEDLTPRTKERVRKKRTDTRPPLQPTDGRTQWRPAAPANGKSPADEDPSRSLDQGGHPDPRRKRRSSVSAAPHGMLCVKRSMSEQFSGNLPESKDEDHHGDVDSFAGPCVLGNSVESVPSGGDNIVCDKDAEALKETLMRVNLMRYWERMHEECVRPEDFFTFTVEEWRELGVALGHRKVLTGAVELDLAIPESLELSLATVFTDDSWPDATKMATPASRSHDVLWPPPETKVKRDPTRQYDVFISYRRKDGMDLAGRVHAELVALGLCPFYDRECLPAGEYAVALEAGIHNAVVFLPLITDGYLDVERMKAHDTTPDYCRAELEAAMRLGKPIIPVVQEGFSECFERAKQLPSPVSKLFDNDVVSVSNEFFSNGTIHKIFTKVMGYRE